MAVIQQDEIVVGLKHPKNNQIHFHPTNDILESSFFPYASGPGCPSALHSLMAEGVPGHRIHVSIGRKKGRFSHTLNDPDKRGKLREAQLAASKIQPIGLKFDNPPEDIEYQLVRDEDVQTWLYHMSCLVQRGYAVLLSGKLEKPEAYLKTGKVKRPNNHPEKDAPKYILLETEESASVK
jgi:hypothetical protein